MLCLFTEEDEGRWGRVCRDIQSRDRPSFQHTEGGGGLGVLSQRQDENNAGRRIVLIKTLWLLIKYCAV